MAKVRQLKHTTDNNDWDENSSLKRQDWTKFQCNLTQTAFK